MPGKLNRPKEAALSRDAGRLAGDFLKSAVDVASFEQRKLTDAEKGVLVHKINTLFSVPAHRDKLAGQKYTMRKLEDWLGNALYKHRLAKRQHQPDSWKSGQRTVRRRKVSGGSAIPGDSRVAVRRFMRRLTLTAVLSLNDRDLASAAAAVLPCRDTRSSTCMHCAIIHVRSASLSLGVWFWRTAIAARGTCDAAAAARGMRKKCCSAVLSALRLISCFAVV